MVNVFAEMSHVCQQETAHGYDCSSQSVVDWCWLDICLPCLVLIEYRLVCSCILYTWGSQTGNQICKLPRNECRNQPQNIRNTYSYTYYKFCTSTIERANQVYLRSLRTHYQMIRRPSGQSLGPGATPQCCLVATKKKRLHILTWNNMCIYVYICIHV